MCDGIAKWKTLVNAHAYAFFTLAEKVTCVEQAILLDRGPRVRVTEDKKFEPFNKIVTLICFLIVSYLVLNNVTFPNDKKQQVKRVVVMETMDNSNTSAIKKFEYLSKAFPNNVGLLHGKTNIEDKEMILNDFLNNKFNDFYYSIISRDEKWFSCSNFFLK